jgi:hypothetical protein
MSDPVSSRTTVVFLHIPKTAGTSFNSALSWEYWWRPSYRVPLRDFGADKFKALPESERAKLSLLRGHMHFGLHEYLPQPSTYVTFLRKPAERIISYWETAQREAAARPESKFWLLQAARTMTLEEAIRTGNHIEFDNAQVRRVSGMKAPVGQCTSEMLAKAKENIEQYFSFVGLTNYFDESLLLLRRILRWRKPPFYAKAKVSPPKSERSRADLKLIQAHNEMDSALYNYAEARFISVLDEARPWLDQELARFRKMNQYYGLVRRFSKRLMAKGKRLKF